MKLAIQYVPVMGEFIAYDEDSVDGDSNFLVGYGKTEHEAIEEYIENIRDRYEERYERLYKQASKGVDMMVERLAQISATLGPSVEQQIAASGVAA